MSKNITFAGNILIASGSHRQFLDNWGDLERYCGYREDNIPQLEDINRHLSKSANQHISTSTGTSANQQISPSISLNQLAPSTTWRHQQTDCFSLDGDNFCLPGIFAARQVSRSDQWLAISRPGPQKKRRKADHFDIFAGTSWPALPSGSSIALSKEFFKKMLNW